MCSAHGNSDIILQKIPLLEEEESQQKYYDIHCDSYNIIYNTIENSGFIVFLNLTGVPTSKIYFLQTKYT